MDGAWAERVVWGMEVEVVVVEVGGGAASVVRVVRVAVVGWGAVWGVGGERKTLRKDDLRTKKMIFIQTRICTGGP